jgi:SpoIIAA-like
MFTVIDGLPDRVIGVKAAGEISASDYTDVLDPLITEATEKGKVRLLYVAGPELEGYSGGAAWQDTKLGFSHFTSFERVAIVTDRKGLEGAVKAVGWLMPGDIKVFAVADKADATTWLVGG